VSESSGRKMLVMRGSNVECDGNPNPAVFSALRPSRQMKEGREAENTSIHQANIRPVKS